MFFQIICPIFFLFLFGWSVYEATMSLKREKYKAFAWDITFALFFATQFMYFFVMSLIK